MANPSNSDPMDVRERIARRLQQVGITVGGETGSRIANRISWAIGCGRIELCDDPACPNCA
ncbi:hypothetical protein [Streptomyces abyssomicinicus]|uniref:hypothetical protein n=1 Tax=Streptomyces abyssomicinicus TaxID=574929 RepID=UPI001250769F|nr:hypothetical protein [Streptomyces abyssomicinicus]